MERTFRIKLANAAKEWPEVIAQRALQRIVDGLATRRAWEIEDKMEAAEVGWTAYAMEGTVGYLMSLTVPTEMTKEPPPRVIDWTLAAYAWPPSPRGRLDQPLIVIITLGTAALLAALGIHWNLRFYWVALAAILGIPVGAFLSIAALVPLGMPRERQRVNVAVEFFREVAAAVEQLPRQG